MMYSIKKVFAFTMVLLLVFTFSFSTCYADDTGDSISYTSEEKEMLEYIVQQEAGGYDLEHKQAIAQVVINRVSSSLFPDSIYEVLTQKNQFSSLSNWYSGTNKPDDDTIQAVSDVLNGNYDDKTSGATFFYAPKWAGKKAATWFENHLTFLFAMDGHRFFKSKS